MSSNMSHKDYELFSHDADVGVRGFGQTINQAFENAAIALTAVICDPKTVYPSDEIYISCHAPDLELLFVDWLNAVIYEMDTRKMLFSYFEVSITDDLHLTARMKGEAVNHLKHQLAVDVKGATYTELEVKQKNNNQWIAQCIVDV